MIYSLTTAELHELRFLLHSLYLKERINLSPIVLGLLIEGAHRSICHINGRLGNVANLLFQFQNLHFPFLLIAVNIFTILTS